LAIRVHNALGFWNCDPQEYGPLHDHS